MQNGVLRSVEAGNVTSGTCAPFGYDVAVVDGKRMLFIDEEEAAVVRLLFDLYATKGHSLEMLCIYLDEHCVSKSRAQTKRRRRKQWSRRTVANMLGNETYTGHWHYRKSRGVKTPATGKKTFVPRPREDWIEIKVPAIIAQETFAAVQQRRIANKTQMGRQRRNFYALGGMIRCGLCGNAVTGVTRTYGDGDKYQYKQYKCGAHLSPRRYGFKCELPHFD